MYNIEFSSKLQTAKIPKQDYLRIRDKVIILAQDPRPRWSEKLKNRDAYRIAVGNYRVLYEIDEGKKLVVILTIGHRKDVYRS